MEEMGEIEMHGRTLLAYTPAYYTCRVLQHITEELTVLAHSHPFNSTPNNLFLFHSVGGILYHRAHCPQHCKTEQRYPFQKPYLIFSTMLRGKLGL